MKPSTRAELALSFDGEGVELGVAAGHFSQAILKNGLVTKLWSIDRWSDHHDSAEYKAAADRLAKYGYGRCIPLRMTFSEALPLFKDESLNFIYIDGYARTGQEGGQTLADWWPKLTPGGIFAGHDYHEHWKPTIEAVDAFIDHHGLEIQLTEGSDQYPSWWTVKPGGEQSTSWTLMDESPIKQGQSVILVGNGPSMAMRGARGPLIDSFDQVVRFNWYAIKGFEDKVGTKTTLWSTFGRGSKPRDEGEIPERAVYIHGSKPKKFDVPVKQAWGISREFFNEVNNRVRQHSARGNDDTQKLLPSSGLVVALWLLDVYQVPSLTLAGFDHFSKEESKGHHYWILDAQGLPSPFKKPPEHDGEAEIKVLAPYLSSGRVSHL